MSLLPKYRSIRRTMSFSAMTAGMTSRPVMSFRSSSANTLRGSFMAMTSDSPCNLTGTTP